MTESLGPDAHLGLDRISDLEEGLLTPDEAQAAREHIAGCPQCQRDVAALAAVREALLADAELPMPQDIADRLHAVLAEQVPLVPMTAAVTTLPSQRPPGFWDRARKPALAGLAAGGAIALIAVGVVHLPRSTSSKSAAAAAPSVAPAPVLHTGHDYTQSLGADGAALLAQLPVTGTAAASAAAPSSAAAAAVSQAGTVAAAAATSAAASAAGATSGGAAEAAPAATSAAAAPVTAAAAATAGPTRPLTNAGTTNAAPASPPAPSTDVLAQLRLPGAAQTCIQTLLPSAGAPLVLDFGRFGGKPVVIGVLNDPDDATKLDVIAVGPPGCSLVSLQFTPKP